VGERGMMKIAISFVIGISVLAFILNGTANWLEAQPADRKFAVVDNYKGCEVVQYSPTNAARYYYFLHCK
jgi:hypothetical protein